MYNGRLSRNIVDLVSVLKPSVSIVDGIIAGKGHKTSGNPVEMNLAIARKNPVGAVVMGVRFKDWRLHSP